MQDPFGLHRQPVDEYRAVPAGRWRQPWSPRSVTVLTTVGALVVGFLLSAGLAAGRGVARQQDSRRAELIELIDARQEHTTVLSAQLEELRSRLIEVEDQAAVGLPALRDRLRAMEVAAGMTGVKGPGVRVTLSDGSGSCPTGREEDCRIQDADLQLAVNTLFAIGAEAMSVNGERIIATTALRGAGRSVLVNYRVLTSPYTIEAVGNAERLQAGFADSRLADDFRVWRDVYGLGMAVEPVEELVLPSYSGSVRLRSATAAEDRS